MILYCDLAVPPEDMKKQTFYKMKEGESNEVRIKFRANPKPNAGQWRIGKVTTPIGAESTDQKFSSTGIENGVS